jgi:hypothetical protein
MRRVLAYTLIAAAVLIGLAVALVEYATERDRANLKAAMNKCEIGCVQDSGGIDQCRPICAQHPDHYP